MPFGVSHKPLVALANSAITSFFREIEVIGTENVPTEGPIIFACSHANMAVDPACLSCTMPHGHMLHYWVKDSLFANPAVGALLRNAGNIPVDRKSKNNQLLFKGTFEALAIDESIGVFPEGTSHTEPHMIALKDGTSWTALEYILYLQGASEDKEASNTKKRQGKKAVIVPVGVAYVDKTKYRSRAVVQYGKPITMDEYEEEFLSGNEGANKHAVKKLTRKIDTELRKMTVNAPDWDTAFAARMALELSWEDENRLLLIDYVDVSQTLIDLFSTSHPSITKLKETLVTYHKLLVSSRLSNTALTAIPLPKTLDPQTKTPLPNRFSTLYLLIKDTVSCAVRLPFFFIPMIIHLPIYLVGVMGGRLVEDEMETQAQMKIAFGLLVSFLMYPVLFFALWAVFRQVPLGFVVAAGTLWLLRRYHHSLVDANYDAMKRLVAAWRILVGVWLPRRFEMPLPSFLASSSLFAPDPPKIAGLPPSTPKAKYQKPKHLPSRVLVRHVLRMRQEAARDLSSLLSEIEMNDEHLFAQFWLAEAYGGEVIPSKDEEGEGVAEWERPLPEGRRYASEVIRFLRDRGARFVQGETSLAGEGEDHWAAAHSGDEEVKSGDED